jgi:cytochrome c2
MSPSSTALLSLLLLLAACRPALRPADADPQRGRRLMAQYQCGSCHKAESVFAADGRQGPALDYFGRRSYIAGELPNTAAQLQRWLLNPPASVPGTTMPVLGVSAADARDIAAYLLSQR